MGSDTKSDAPEDVIALGNSYMVSRLGGREAKGETAPQPFRVYFMGQVALNLAGDAGALIVQSFFHMTTVDKQRADDYMAGVVQGVVLSELEERRARTPRTAQGHDMPPRSP